MNKQEAIEKIKRRTKYFKVVKEYNRGFRDGLNSSIHIIREIDEPKKPVVPQFVADFYESIKNDFEDKVYDLCVQFNLDESELNSDVARWFDCSKNKPIETLVMMHKFGYRVNKEKLYITRNKTTGEYLYFNNDEPMNSEDKTSDPKTKRLLNQYYLNKAHELGL